MKIFGVGLSRTGTTSLTAALRMLGYRTVHFPTNMDQIVRCDAATDSSVAYRFEELDQRFPGSKFILTERDEQGWLKSYEQFRTQQIGVGDNLPMMQEARRSREVVYGTQEFDPDIWLAGYRRHNQRVKEYFADRPRDFIVMNIPGGDGWEKLCAFLGKPIPKEPFPNTNKSSQFLRSMPPWLSRTVRIPYVLGVQAYGSLRYRWKR
ncbi:MAG: hypothetical protein KIT09_30150 [Bryobacteraceae bacterium]|nr:hypothetical protein [Bryobacteraceae bacterium]